MKGMTVVRKGTIGPRMLVESSGHFLSLFGVLYMSCSVVYVWNGRYVRLTLDADELEQAHEFVDGQLATYRRPRPDGTDMGRG